MPLTRVFDRSCSSLQGLLATRWSFAVLCVAYGVAVMVISAPVLTASIGADDTYWTLNSLEATDGSALNAIGLYLGEIISPDLSSTQPRTVEFAHAARRILAVLVLQTSVAFSVPVAVPWAVAKVALILVTIAAVAALLCQVRFRDAEARVRGIHRDSIVFVLLVLPLAMALGMKVQGIGGLNGWVEYPVLTYSALPIVLTTAALSLWLVRKLSTNFTAWLWPAIAMLALVAFVLTHSYEFVAVAIPVSLAAILLHPRERHDTAWRRWRPHATVGAALAGAYAVFFLLTRWRLASYDCVQNGTCYGGTTIAIDPQTLFYGFVGALPSSATQTVVDVVESTGRSLPPVFTVVGLLTGLLAVLLLWAAWHAWRIRPGMDPQATDAAAPRSDARGLGVVALLAVLGAIGISVVSGITPRAIEWLITPDLPYRSGPAVWTGLVLAGAAGLRVLLTGGSRTARRVVGGGIGALVVLAVGHLLPLNLVVAQSERALPRTQAADAIHWDVVLGDLTAEGDARRCEHAARWTSVVGSAAYYERTLRGAESAFQFLYDMPYCTEGE